MVMGNFKTGFGAESSGPTAPTSEEISLLIDGELEPVRADAVVTSLCRAEGLATWVCYHVIGVASRGLDSKRFVELFAAEPTVLAPRRSPAPHAIALALAATVAAVSVVGWVALTTMPTPVAASARRTPAPRSTTSMCWCTRNTRRPMRFRA